MRKFFSSFSFAFLLAVSVSFADYPILSIKDFAKVSQDSLNVNSLRSPYEGDTITLTGIVAIPPCFDPEKNDFRPLLGGLNGVYVSILRDLDQSLTSYAGVSVIQMDTSDVASNFRNIKEGDVVSLNVVVQPIATGGGFGGNNFPGRLRTPTCILLPGSSANVKVAENKPISVNYPKVTVSQFYTQTQFGQQFNVKDGAPFLRMPVTLENLTVFRNGGDVLLWDEVSSTFIAMSDLSGYFTEKQHRFPESDYEVPVNGQKINKIKGYILPAMAFNQIQLFTIVPVKSSDVEMGPKPPEILGVTRSFDRLFPHSDDNIQIDVRVDETESKINPDSVLLFYSVDGKPFQSIKCSDDGFGYSTVIPAQSNGSVVRYYASVKDEKGVGARNPLSGTLHYIVKDGTAAIADFINPLQVPNSQMARNNYGVNFEGIVTTDTNDIRFGIVGRYITVQDSRNPFSAIQIAAINPAHPIFELKRGDKVKFSGKLQANNNSWIIMNPTDFELVSSSNTMEPIIIDADSLGAAFVGNSNIEGWRTMLVEVRDLKIIDTNSRNGQNNGSFAVASIKNPVRNNSFNIETLQSYIRYTTVDSLVIQWSRERPVIGYNIAWVRGTLTSNNQTYSIVPRNNDDFGAVTTIEDSDNSFQENVFPNPASNTIVFDVPVGNELSISVYNSTGENILNSLQMDRTLNIQELQNGQYFALVREGMNNYQFTFTVMR